MPHKGIYHCFGCGEGGDVFAFVQKTRGLSFYEAVKELAEQAGVTIEERELSPEELRRMRARAGLHEICQMAAEHWHANLLTRAEGREALAYLKARGVTDESIATFKIGYAPESWDDLLNRLHREGVTVEQAVAAGLARWREPGNRRRGAYDLFRDRIIIPILDRRGRPIAFGGRILTDRDGAPKYVNSPETDIYKKSRTLYGLSNALAAIQRNNRLLVVEGYFDVIALHQAGFPEAVATCGTSLTEQHLQAIRTLTGKVIALFDADEAGMRAAERSLPLFFSANIEPLRLTVEGAKDPDEYIQEYGANAFEDLLVKAEPLFEVVMRRVAGRCGPTPGGRQQAVEELVPSLRRLTGPSRSAHIERLAQFLRVDVRSIFRMAGPGQRGGGRGARPLPSRWNPHPRLRTLLWLMLNYPGEVAEELVDFPHPEWLTDNGEALRAIGMLLQGAGLPEVMEAVADVDVARLLREEATRELNYEPSQARQETLTFLRDIELKHMEEELFLVQQQVDEAFAAGRVDRELLQRKTDLQKQIGALKRSRTWRLDEAPEAEAEGEGAAAMSGE